MYQRRCERAQEMMKEKGIDWLFVSLSSDMVYLTGINRHPSERLTLLMVPREGRPKMIIPAFEAVKLEVEGHEIFYDVLTWDETDDPIAHVADAVSADATVAVGEKMWSGFLIKIQEVLPEASYVDASDVLVPLRIRKDDAEISALQRVGELMDLVFTDVCSLRFAGRTEVEVGGDVFDIARQHGLNPTRAGGVSAGPNSASPHHASGQYTIEEGDAIWVELGQGGGYDNYAADMTRAFHVGEPSEKYIQAYRAVLAGFNAAFEAARPGVTCQDVDRAARQVISDAGFGDYFIHRVGHGLGIDGHEPPWMVEGNTDLVETGMVFSVEPGVYIPGEFGIRVEDIVYVTDDGARSIYTATRDWVVVQ